jgi:AcrR family transcriptional regulator
VSIGVTVGDMQAPTQQKRPYHMASRSEAAQATSHRVLDVAISRFTYRPYDDVSLEDIAAAAGVTKRTILRRFASKEQLFLAAMERGGMEEMRRRDEAPVGDVAAATAILVASYERWGANRLRVLAQEDRIPVVAENVALGRQYHWSWVERTFGSLLHGATDEERRRRLAALISLTDVYTWKVLRKDLGLSQAETERVLVDLIEKLEGER